MNSIPATKDGKEGGGYLHALGLAREPFGEGIEEDFYYSETQRAKCLHFLLHLAPYSDVLLLTGDKGSGKSSLVQQFIHRASPTWRICALDGSEIDSPRRLLEELAEVFLFDVTDDQAQTLANLHRMLAALRNSALVPVLIIDEAQQLSLEVLQLLAQLVEHSDVEDRQLCIILVGEPALESRLLEAPLRPLRARVGHSFELPPFDAQQTAAYVQHRLAVAGVTGSTVFEPAALEEIHHRAGGLPGRINTCAREMLRRGGASHPHPGGADEDASHTTGGLHSMPAWRHPVVIVLAVLLGGVLIFQDAINGWLQGDADVVQPLELPAPPPVKPLGSLPGTAPQSDRRVPQAAPPSPARPPEATPTPPRDEAAVPAPSPAAGGSPQKASALQGGGPAPPSPPEVPAPAAAAPVSAGGAAAGETAPPPPAKEAAPPTTPAPAARPTQASPELLRQDWLQSRDPAHYTLQLVAMDKAKVLNLIERWGLAGKAATFYTQGRLLALVYGDYPDRAAAMAAARAMAQRLAGTRPWVRSFASIQTLLMPSAMPTRRPAARQVTPAVDRTGDARARLLTDEEALLQRDPSHYALQLMAMDLSAVVRRVRRWGLSSQVRYYRTLRGDRELVAVIYGDYPDRDRAAAAAAELHRRIPGIRPWVRRVAAVQNAVHAFRAIHR